MFFEHPNTDPLQNHQNKNKTEMITFFLSVLLFGSVFDHVIPLISLRLSQSSFGFETVQFDMAQDPQALYFAVGPGPNEITCPYCRTKAKTRVVRSWLRCCTKRHHCGACGEYLGVYRRPQL
ncbi:uncharacterized protein LOC119550148 [Drosophila subpulchrella]|uniref:uncharacterized protein LOC119550148 n=2 Tax=melanogaster group TaxID=32346 RepID=UPI0018A14B27|nr:uncharacterized protein LOC119550148 [Drosophila subpulchrella]